MKKLAAALLLALTLTAQAAPFSTPNTFSAGSAIKAADMNANFTAVQTELRRLADANQQSLGAFIHTATAATITSNFTCLDNPLTNSNPGAIITFAHNWDVSYILQPLGIYYNTSRSKWCIFNEDTAKNFIANTKFNIIVYKP